MSAYHIFIVEDDTWYGEVMQYHIGLNPDYNVTRFETAKACLDKLYLQPDVITIDFKLPDMRGDKLFKKIREVDALVPSSVVSEQGHIAVRVDLLKMGSTDYLVKDEGTEELLWNSIIR